MRIPMTTLMSYIGFICLILGCFGMTALVALVLATQQAPDTSEHMPILFYSSIFTGLLGLGMVLAGIGILISVKQLIKKRRAA